MNSLEGQLAVITGAGGGIGVTMVQRFQDAGARVVACDVSEEALEHLDVAHKEIFDLGDPDACRQACARIQSAVGLPDILVSNAGYTRAETFEQVDDRAWTFELDINLNGVRNFTAPFLEPMKARGSGVFVFVSSVNALAHFGNPAYAVAKAGLVAYARAIATEWGVHGIRSNTICPGSVRTHAWDHRIEKDPQILDKVSRLYPIGHMVSPVDVANAAVFLASPLSAGITGVTLPVDGGLMAGNLPFIEAIR
ncbi:SDR family oxidoreductase [Microvirga guangxiensis]|uniref:NAD(P)-dependent dehydrogenase, short-chain alcohol dehydrogenase family n=1 Tax=Microvirga guangxiensis TaxID=549386 RepID=A0A1G5IW53_9HYPH|nr:SDR family oxidoreductase [Microvirga guangxiensis]SCY79658.1 NAD(P)-dependent dehydrogenase, short-chain alcohol dehydrogenase family [Microvirga guangxiensis]